MCRVFSRSHIIQIPVELLVSPWWAAFPYPKEKAENKIRNILHKAKNILQAFF